MSRTLKSLGETKQYEYVNKTIESWPSWKQEVYKNFNSSSEWIKCDSGTGRFIDRKTSNGPFKGVRKDD